MGYAIFPYLVDLHELQEVYGSNRTDIVRQIEQQRFPEYIVKEPSTLEALREIVAGELRWTEMSMNHNYGDALHLLCLYLGTPLPNEEWDGLTARGIWLVGEIDGLKELNDAPKLPIPVPSWTGFPGVTYLTSHESAIVLARFRSIDVPEAPPDPEWIKSAQEQYLSWLSESAMTQKALVAFLE